jgi:hypothetical protein
MRNPETKWIPKVLYIICNISYIINVCALPMRLAKVMMSLGLRIGMTDSRSNRMISFFCSLILLREEVLPTNPMPQKYQTTKSSLSLSLSLPLPLPLPLPLSQGFKFESKSFGRFLKINRDWEGLLRKRGRQIYIYISICSSPRKL